MNISKVKIYGAGSIGNHLTNAARTLGCAVSVVDRDPEALRRMREEIYPARYGKWDDSINLYTTEDEPKGEFDLICIGTPPSSHLPLALVALEENPKALQIEKPACMPDLANASELVKQAREHDIKVFIGYDHVVGKSANKTLELLRQGEIGDILTFDVEFREFWGGIFAAHPWLEGPHDSYLGYWKQGGGASGEHSHALNLWQHFAHELGFGRVKSVDAMLHYMRNDKTDYDDLCFLNLQTEHDMYGRVVQDVVTQPVKKEAHFQGTRGHLTLHVSYDKEGDAITLHKSGADPELIKIPKSRPDDFIDELKHIDSALQPDAPASPLNLERGLDTMLVICAAHEAHLAGKRATLASKATYTPADIIL